MFKKLFGGKPEEPQFIATQAYHDWRQMILAIPPQQGGLAADGQGVYGVIMEIGMLDQQKQLPWAISLSAFASGEASFQPSPGGGVLGLGGEPKIQQLAQEIVQIGDKMAFMTQPAGSTELPKPGFVHFIFLTTGGLRAGGGQLNELQQPNNPYLHLLNRFGLIRQFADHLIDQQRRK